MIVKVIANRPIMISGKRIEPGKTTEIDDFERAMYLKNNGFVVILDTIVPKPEALDEPTKIKKVTDFKSGRNKK